MRALEIADVDRFTMFEDDQIRSAENTAEMNSQASALTSHRAGELAPADEQIEEVAVIFSETMMRFLYHNKQGRDEIFPSPQDI